MRIVAISDTHNRKPEVPSGDVLVHTGDLTMGGHLKEYVKALDWLASLKEQFPNIIFIAGNHDYVAESNPKEVAILAENRGLTYLFDSGVEVDGVKFWGSPYQPWFHDWAFNLERGPEIQEIWDKIPQDTDVLLTHGPPMLHGDMTARPDGTPRGRVGCENLLRTVHDWVKPKLHVFGHIHEDYGVSYDNETCYVNASTCDLSYHAENPPIIIDLTEDGSVSIVNEQEVTDNRFLIMPR
jgi:Icc-related predicted phosphoesterase